MDELAGISTGRRSAVPKPDLLNQDPLENQRSRSTLRFGSLHHRSARVENWGIYLLGFFSGVWKSGPEYLVDPPYGYDRENGTMPEQI